jgi:hypothetical protein
MSATDVDYSWVKKANGEFQRPLDPLEQVMVLFGNVGSRCGRKHFIIHYVVNYTSEEQITPEDLKRTWISLRSQHPSFAAIAGDSRKLYQNDWADWIEETFVISSKNPEQIFATSAPINRPMLFVLPEETIVFKVPHEFSDGIGLLQLTDKFFTLLKDIKDGGDSHEDVESRLSAPSFVVAPIPPSGPNAESEANAYLQKIMEPSIGLSVPNLDQIPEECAVYRLSLTSKESEAVIKACRASRFTVTTAVHAALLMAVQKAAGKGTCKAFTPINTRFRGKNDVLDFAVPCMVATPVVVPPGPFSQTAEKLRKHYAASKEYDLENHRHICDKFIELLSSPPPPTPETHPELSSLGIVEKYVKREYGKVCIKDVHPSIVVLLPHPRLFLWTFRDQINLNITFNEKYFDLGTMESLLSNTIEILRKELNI